MRDRICNIRIFTSCPAAEDCVVINIPFHMHSNLDHHLKGFHRILAGSCLSGKHDRARSLSDRICHVCRLRTGRAGMDHHGVKHLCSSDDNLSRFIDFLDDPLLDDRHVFQRYLHTHVASGDHDAVCLLDDRVNIIHALLIFNLGDDVDLLTAVIVEKLSHLPDIVGRSCK